jgi:nucleoside-diphosphate-sugar epimerase
LRTLVAGGSGFIGSHVVDMLLAAGHHVTVVDNFLTGRRQNLSHNEGDPALAVIAANVAELLPLGVVAEPYDRVYHLASPASPTAYQRYPLETLLVNSVGTFQLLDVARSHGARFLLASTAEVYGDPLVHPQDETYWGNVNPIGPRSCYDESKRFAESIAVNYADVHGVDVRIARIFNTYGPRSAPEDGRLIPTFCVQALTGAPLTVYGDGSQTRSLCYVTDLVGGLGALMEADGLAGQVVNLGNPGELTVLAIAEEILTMTGSRSTIEYRPLPVDDPARRRPDIRKARRLLGWEPTVKLADGLLQTLAFFRDDMEQPTIPTVSCQQ